MSVRENTAEDSRFGEMESGFSVLTMPEMDAVHMRYLGKSYATIAKHTGISKRTVEDWFTADGRLSEYFVSWSYEMNRERVKKMQESLAIQDEEIFRVIRKMLELFEKRLEGGKYQPNFRDVFKCFLMQRILGDEATEIRMCQECGKKERFTGM